MTLGKESETGMLSSKYWRAFLVIVSAAFTFGGPYVAYVFTSVLGIGFTLSVISGFVLFIIGLVLIWYLVRKKVIS
jgi:hypothetical protein